MSNNSGKGFLFLLGGALIGAAAGILFAPDKGYRTRRRISKQMGEIKDSMGRKFDELVDQAETLVSDLRSTAAEVVDEVKEEWNERSKTQKEV
ncbi:MAG: YtxH domain-containing protein [Prevotellaceae bacterium]|jgi:gas vesicle protein|nr:YtxH domain-containing protein [Prevotellaceae bacterium]